MRNAISKESLAQREHASGIQKHWVRLTRSCNNRCLFCLDKEAQNNSMIPFARVKNDLIRGRKKGADRAVLSGGEPTLHPRFPDIIALAKKIGFKNVQVVTNGRMFAYRGFLHTCLRAGLDEITFSIHGHTEKLHDSLTKTPGSFRETIRALKNALGEKHLVVSVDIVLNKKNVKSLKSTITYLMGLGVREFDLLQVMPYGRAWDERSTLLYDPRRFMPYLKQAFRLSLKPGLFIWTNRFPAGLLEGYEHLIQSPFKLKDEIEGRSAMFRDLFRNNKPLSCAGERCSYCVLQDFCVDLAAFRKNKFLAPKINRCLASSDAPSAPLAYPASMDAFLRFFIINRYFLKGRACRTCAERDACDGFPIEHARVHGFKKPDTIKSNIPYTLIRLGLACNARCLFCNVPQETYKDKTFSLCEAKAEITRLAHTEHQPRISLSGGEPTLRRDLPDIIRWAKTSGIDTIELQTNGIRLADPGYTLRLKNAGLKKIFLSLHSHIPEEHDALMGKKGSFQECTRGLKNALASGMDVALNFVATTLNQSSLPAFVQFLAKDFPQVRSLSLSVVQPRGRAWKDRGLVPRYSILSPFVKQALEIAQKNDLIINNPYCGLPLCVGGWHEHLAQCVEYCENKLKLLKGSGALGMSADKIKAPRCRACVLTHYCNGVWKEYAMIHPLDDLRPIR